MKGNQGLEALAALCGGASKADEGNSSLRLSDKTIASSTSCILPSSSVPNDQIPFSREQGTTARANLIPSEITNWQNTQTSVLNNSLPNQSVFFSAADDRRLSQMSTSDISSTIPNHSTNAMQQLSYLQLIQNQAANAAQLLQNQTNLSNPVTHLGQCHVDANAAAIAMILATQNCNDGRALVGTLQENETIQKKVKESTSKMPPFQQILPVSSPKSLALMPSGSSGSSCSIKNPHVLPMPVEGKSGQVPINAVSSDQTAASKVNLSYSLPVLMRRPLIDPDPVTSAPLCQAHRSTTAKTITSTQKFKNDNNLESSHCILDLADKKQQKRAANRRSAQLSRKRKKVFIEELKEENNDLRRKEKILKSIPDLIVVFDSGGKILFVSQSVTRFLDFTPTELEGSSFWNRLCDESIRLLKAAFMDALAAKEKDSDTAPLGSGVWELRLKDKDQTCKDVTMNGVVHFSEDIPECVCSIRPRDTHLNVNRRSSKDYQFQILDSQKVKIKRNSFVSNDGIRKNMCQQENMFTNCNKVSTSQTDIPQSRVKVNLSTEDHTNRKLSPHQRIPNRRIAAQISDADSNSSFISESNSTE